MVTSDPQVLVVGGGIAGLALATALAQRGFAVEVLEQAAAFTDVGAGVQISPNGARVLHALGLGHALAAGSVRAEAVVLHDGLHQSAPLIRMDLVRSGPFHLLHRADLLAMLAGAARDAGACLSLNWRATRITAGVRPGLTLADGTRRTAALIVGADGLNSQVRAALNGAETPFFTGQVAWRALCPAAPGTAPIIEVFTGPGRHLVSYPLRGGALRNIVAVEERRGWAAEGWSHSDDPAHLRAAFRDFCPRVQSWLGPIDQVSLWGLHRHQVAQRWQGDGLAILGDAAHPTLPFLAQGANMALEDAWVLANTVARNLPMSQYQAARQARTARIVAAANRNARAYHLAGRKRAAAHLALRLAGRLAPDLMLRRYDWVYRHDVTGGAPPCSPAPFSCSKISHGGPGG